MIPRHVAVSHIFGIRFIVTVIAQENLLLEHRSSSNRRLPFLFTLFSSGIIGFTSTLPWQFSLLVSLMLSNKVAPQVKIVLWKQNLNDVSAALVKTQGKQLNENKPTNKSEIHDIWRPLSLLFRHWKKINENRLKNTGIDTPRVKPDACTNTSTTTPQLIRPPPPTSAFDLSYQPPLPTSADLHYRPPPTSATDLQRPPLPTSVDLRYRPPPTSATDPQRPPLPTSTDLRYQPPLPTTADLHYRPPPTSATDLHRPPLSTSATDLRYRPPSTSATDPHRPPLPTPTDLRYRPPPTSVTDLRLQRKDVNAPLYCRVGARIVIEGIAILKILSMRSVIRIFETRYVLCMYNLMMLNILCSVHQ